jgi:uncharacterized protein YdhG (YjbR/CyaY superfamily)
MNPEITSYIAACPIQAQQQLKNIRNFILQEVPQAEEVISYKMPAYKLHGMLVYFAGYEKHIGFYPTGSGIKQFESEIQNYKYSKGTIQFPIEQELPYELIRRIIQFRVQENEAKLAVKKLSKK